jgi:hypothetical protein
MSLMSASKAASRSAFDEKRADLLHTEGGVQVANRMRRNVRQRHPGHE